MRDLLKKAIVTAAGVCIYISSFCAFGEPSSFVDQGIRFNPCWLRPNPFSAHLMNGLLFSFFFFNYLLVCVPCVTIFRTPQIG